MTSRAPGPLPPDPALRLRVRLQPATVNALQYAMMVLMRQHTRSLPSIDDVRVLVDAVIDCAPGQPDVELRLDLESSHAGVVGRLQLCPYRSDVGVEDVRPCVDELAVSTDGTTMRVDFSRRW